jgi:hypothetical protein
MIRWALYASRMIAAHGLLRACKVVPSRYLAWLFYRWSIVCAPHVTPQERYRALQWWDLQGRIWGYLPASASSSKAPASKDRWSGKHVHR